MKKSEAAAVMPAGTELYLDMYDPFSNTNFLTFLDGPLSEARHLALALMLSQCGFEYGQSPDAAKCLVAQPLLHVLLDRLGAITDCCT